MVKLATGADMPIIGLGTWQSTPEEVILAVETAIDCGYRHIDTAFAYRNEESIGKAIRGKIAAGVIKREDIFVVTKLHVQYHGRQGVKEGIEKSLTALGLDYVDLYLVHGPVAFKRTNDDQLFPVEDGKPATLEIDHLDTWKGMEDAFKAGKAKAIGLSNFNHRQIQRIYDHAEIKPHNLQVECHAHFPQFKLHDFCKKLNITFCAYAPLGSPNRKSNLPGVPDANRNDGPMFDDRIKAIAEKHGKTPAQVALRYLTQREIIVIPKSITPERIRANFDIFNFKLSDDEMKTMNNLGIDSRTFDVPFLKGHKEYPFGEEY